MHVEQDERRVGDVTDGDEHPCDAVPVCVDEPPVERPCIVVGVAVEEEGAAEVKYVCARAVYAHGRRLGSGRRSELRE